MGLYWLKLFIALPIVLLLLWFLSNSVQKTQLFPKKQTKLSIVDQLRVSPKATLQVVRVGSQYLMFSVCDQQVILLKEFSAEEAAEWDSSAIETLALSKGLLSVLGIEQVKESFKKKRVRK